MDHNVEGAGSDFLQLDPRTAPPRGRAAWLVDRVRDAITRGQLDVGARLPTTRALAADLGWSRGVVVEAYARLREQGLTTGNARGGTRIAFAPAGYPAARAATTPEAVPDRRSSTLGPASRAVDLTPGVPDLTRFPRAAWLRAQRYALTQPASRLRYGDPAGEPALRHELATWLASQRGVAVAADDLLVVSGVAQALALVAHTLRRRGLGRVAVEDPGSRGARDMLAYWGLRPVGVPVDEQGMRTDLLHDLLDARPRPRQTDGGIGDAVVVTPAHQYPTGVTLSPSRRVQLLRWAQQTGGLVVEDDYDAEYRYDRNPVASLHPSAPERTVHTGSVSKTLAPALRLGWLVAPAWLRADLLEAKHASDITSPSLPQLALARMLADGSYERHLRLSRGHQRRRRDALAGALRDRLPDARVDGVAAGLHLLLSLPGRDLDDSELSLLLRERGVVTEALSRHRSRPGTPGLVIGYASYPADRLRAAADVIADAVDDLAR